MHLTKMKMRIFFEELLARLQSIELAGVPKRAEGNFMTGPKALSVRFIRH
jgi:cytochrome P450